MQSTVQNQDIETIVENYTEHFIGLLLDYDENKKIFVNITQTIVDEFINNNLYIKIGEKFPEILETATNKNPSTIVYTAYDYLFCEETLKNIIKNNTHPQKHIILCKIILCLNELLDSQVDVVVTDENYDKESKNNSHKHIKQKFKIVYDSLDDENRSLEIIEILKTCNAEDLIKDEHCVVNVDNLKHNICDFVNIQDN